MERFIFDINPVPASRPRVTRYGTYYSAKYEQFRKDMGKLILFYRGKTYKEPIRLDVTFYVAMPKSYSKKERLALDGRYCVSNMDLDNLEKALYDSLNGIVYEDDKQIVCHTTKKLWTTTKGRIQMILETV